MVFLHVRRHFAVDVVHRRAPRQLTVRVTEVIDRAKQLRAFLYQLYIGLPDFICKLLAHQRVRVHAHGVVPAFRQRLKNRLCRRVVPAARAAG